MSTKTPVVSGNWVYDPRTPGAGIRLDSGAWWTWLEATTTTRFSYPLYDRQLGYIVGFMTVRKERCQRGGLYWSAFRRTGSPVRKLYIGRSPAVTHARLQAIADRLHPPGEGSGPATLRVDQS